MPLMHAYQTEIIIGVVLFLVFVLMLGRKRGRARGGYQTQIRWFRTPQNRPAIYIIQSVQDPACIKVGYTGRKVETRMTEIAVKHGPVRLLFSLRMPHAYPAEQTAHARLRNTRRIRSLGNEWYRGDAHRIRREVLKAARTTRRRAKWRFAWPGRTNIFVWKDF